MKAELIRIGNSRGLRIPKPLIEQCGLGGIVELRVENNCLIISPKRKPREGWGEAFRAARPTVREERLLPDFPNKFDAEEWQW
jgi:antitoxin MazE